MSRTAYGWTHEDSCIEDGHCYHHVDRLDLMICCVCRLYKKEDHEREVDSGHAPRVQ